jgi:two-component system phosphate regulon sensor histidine kinase PhoR
MIQQLFEISEIDQSRIIVKPAPIMIAKIIDDAIAKVQDSAKERGVVVEVSPVPTIAGIETDKKLLERCLYEMLTNAILYSAPKGRVKISVSVQQESVVFEVADQGVGIIEKEQPQVYNKFFRGSNFDTTEIIGTGLGMFITREYAKLLKGKVWFFSKAKEGSRFFLALPM